MARLTEEEIQAALPAIADALRRITVNGRVIALVNGGHITVVDASPRYRTWHQGRRIGHKE